MTSAATLRSFMHPAGHGLDRNVGLAAHLAHFENDIGQRPGTAGQHDAAGAFRQWQRVFLCLAMIDLAGHERGLAGAAGAVAATVGQCQPGIERGLQERCIGGGPGRCGHWAGG